MKRVSWILILVIGFVIAFTACEDDEDPDPDADAPSISSITPNTGTPGTAVTIAGTNFGSSPTVNFGSTVATVSSATATSISTTVPSGLAAGAVNVTVTANGQTSSAVSFTVEEGIDDPAAELVQHLMDNDNVIVDPEFGGLSRAADQSLDPIPAADAVTTDLAAYPEGDDFFTEVAYKGAFDPTGTNWMEGWSTLWKLGYLVGSPSTPEAPYDPAAATIETLPNSITADMTLTSDKVWKLDGLTYVESGTLTIEAGTVIIAETDPTADNTSALVVTTGGMIDAQGTAEAPIIFTSEEDDGTLPPSELGHWGGVILLGTAPVGFGTGTNSVEGIDANEPRGQYGGSDADDNSGIMRYVSIRYSGVGIAPGSEIQGLTLGGVGSGTTLEYIDIFASGDDGIEWFGGLVDLKYAIAAFVDDDNWDYDLGWRGRGQFWFSMQNSTGDNVDCGGEWDGADPNNVEPYSNPTLYNVTMLGMGQDTDVRDVTAPVILMRDNAAGTLANSIIADFNGKGIEVEDEADSEGDSYNHLLNGEVNLMNNIWQVNASYTDFTSGETGIIKLTE